MDKRHPNIHTLNNPMDGASCMITHPHWEQEKLSQDKMTTVKNGKMRLFQDALTVSEISFMMTSQMVAALWIGMRIFPPSPLISLGTICTATGGIFRLLYSNGIYRAKNWGNMDSCVVPSKKEASCNIPLIKKNVLKMIVMSQN